MDSLPPDVLADPNPVELHSKSWKGDEIYVILDIVGCAVSIVVGIAVLALFAAGASGMNGYADSSKARENLNALYITLACIGLIVFPLFVAVWTGILNGKKWAYLVTLVLLFCVLIAAVATKSIGLASVVFVICLAKAVYCGLRLRGVVGPPLK